MEYTNSPLVAYTKLSTLTSGQRKHAIDRITPHCYVGQVSVQAMGEWFYANSRSASCNYGIAVDGQIGLYVEEKNRSYCSSNVENDNRAITIECASDMGHPYAFRDIVYNRLVELCTDICKRNGKTKLLWISDKTKRLAYEPAQDEMILTMHRDFFDTACPGDWMAARMGDLANSVTAALGNEEHTPEAPQEPEPDQEQTAEPEQEQPQLVKTGLQAEDLSKLSYVQVVDTLGPLFTAEQRRTGILASISLAQLIVETGYCRSELSVNSNNCFGMKCSLSGNTWEGSFWDGVSKYKLATDEYNADGSKFTSVENFRAYLSMEDSIRDHSAYLLGAKKDDGTLRYAGLKGCTSFKQAANILKTGGYATSPDYVEALLYYNEIWDLEKWDETPKQQQPANENITMTKEDFNAFKASYASVYSILKKYENGG